SAACRIIQRSSWTSCFPGRGPLPAEPLRSVSSRRPPPDGLQCPSLLNGTHLAQVPEVFGDLRREGDVPFRERDVVRAAGHPKGAVRATAIIDHPDRRAIVLELDRRDFIH